MGRRPRPFAADPLTPDFALPGASGKSVARLLADALGAGRAALETVLRTAVERRIDPGSADVRTGPLFDDSERQALTAALERAVVAADLLGRARVRRYADAVRNRGRAAFAADPLADLATLPSATRGAIEFFLSLVPKLGLDPERYGTDMARHAFTLAAATEETLLRKVRDALAGFLGTDWDAPSARGKEKGPAVVQRVLDACGVTAENPQYSEMVFRTNVLDSYNTGATREMATPEMREEFPAWEYLSVPDSRSRHSHAARHGKFYPASVSFAEVRGTDIGDVANCRCTQRPVHATELDELLAAGGRVESRW